MAAHWMRYPAWLRAGLNIDNKYREDLGLNETVQGAKDFGRYALWSIDFEWGRVCCRCGKCSRGFSRGGVLPG